MQSEQRCWGARRTAAWLLAITGLLRVRRSRPRRVRPWALPAWLSLVALLWPAGVAAQGGERVEYYHLDALGSVRVVTDASGQVVRRHDFGPFGEEVAPMYPNPERKLFTGQERDAETALDYFGARYYRAEPRTIHDGRSGARHQGRAGRGLTGRATDASPLLRKTSPQECCG